MNSIINTYWKGTNFVKGRSAQLYFCVVLFQNIINSRILDDIIVLISFKVCNTILVSFSVSCYHPLMS